MAKRFTSSTFRLFLSRAGLPLLLAAVTFCVYGPSLQSDFVYDARAEILEEGFITSLANLPAVLSLKVLGLNLMLGDRPAQLLYLMLNAALWGKTPFGYHLGSNLLHAANVALLFLLLRRLLAAETGSALGVRVQLVVAAVTLLFALHPIDVEAVSAIAYSSDLLVTFFTLLALLAATAFDPVRRRTAWRVGILGVFCALTAVMCKESGLAAAGLLVVYWFLYRRGDLRNPWIFFLSAAGLVVVAFLVARFSMAAPSQIPLGYVGGSFWAAVGEQPRLWVFMMGQLLVPLHLSADYTLENIGALSAPLASVILAVVLMLQAWLASRSRLGALGVAVYWLGLVTVSNLIPLYHMTADRFYYLPLAGVAMQFLAVLLMMRESQLTSATMVLFAVIVPLAVLTVKRESVFANEYALWNDTLQVSPFSSIAHNNFGSFLYDSKQVDAAIAQFNRAVELNPKNALAYNNLCVAFSATDRIRHAITEGRDAVKLAPGNALIHNSLGWALLQNGQVDDAMAEIHEALALNPRHAAAHNNLGVALYRKGDNDAAILEFRRTQEINPDNAEAHYNLGLVLESRGDRNTVIDEYQKALAIKPAYADAHYNLGTIFLRQGQLDEAIAQFQKVLEIDPNFSQVHTNLGIALAQKGRVKEAIAEFERMLQLNPNDRNAQINLTKAQAMMPPLARP
jgi:tetratricopeptide (TPR) repeat protein